MTLADTKTNVNVVATEFFQVSLVTYLLLTLAETLREGFVSNFFNMNYLLAVVLVTGVAMVLTEPAEVAEAAEGEAAEATMQRSAARPKLVRQLRVIGRPVDGIRRRLNGRRTRRPAP